MVRVHVIPTHHTCAIGRAILFGHIVRRREAIFKNLPQENLYLEWDAGLLKPPGYVQCVAFRQLGIQGFNREFF